MHAGGLFSKSPARTGFATPGSQRHNCRNASREWAPHLCQMPHGPGQGRGRVAVPATRFPTEWGVAASDEPDPKAFCGIPVKLHRPCHFQTGGRVSEKSQAPEKLQNC